MAKPVRPVREIMTKEVEQIAPDATVQDASLKMSALNVGALPVCTTDGRPVGMLTDRDIAVRANAAGKDPTRTKVYEVMTPEVWHITPDQDAEEAAWLMQIKKVRRLVVLDGDGRLVGIVSIGDLSTLGQDHELAGEVMEHVAAARSHGGTGGTGSGAWEV